MATTEKDILMDRRCRCKEWKHLPQNVLMRMYAFVGKIPLGRRKEFNFKDENFF
jgi:hypothetical protein